jgi:multidrug efflux pump
MAQLGLGTEDIAEAVKAATSVYPSGTHETRDSNIYLRLTGMSDTLDNLRAVPIAAGGRILRLGDIAEIEKDYADPPEPKMYFNGLPAIGIALSMEERGNNITLGENLDKLAFEVRNELPLGFSLEQVANQPRVVKNAIGEFSTSLFEAIAIVMAVSLLTLGRSSGFVISVCIPLVLLATFIGMYLLGIDLHKVSLGALIVALGCLSMIPSS